MELLVSSSYRYDTKGLHLSVFMTAMD